MFHAVGMRFGKICVLIFAVFQNVKTERRTELIVRNCTQHQEYSILEAMYSIISRGYLFQGKSKHILDARGSCSHSQLCDTQLSAPSYHNAVVSLIIPLPTVVSNSFIHKTHKQPHDRKVTLANVYIQEAVACYSKQLL